MVRPRLSLSLSLFSLWQVSQSHLAFLELQSIFNRVAPLPDGPAIYGPECGQGWKWPGARGWRNVSDDRMMDECGAKMRELAMEESRGMGETWRLLRTKEVRVEGARVFITLSAWSFFFFLYRPAVREWGVRDALVARRLEFDWWLFLN